MKRLDAGLVAEVVGVLMVAGGLAMVSIPIALIAVGSFLVWVTEKAE